MTDIEKIRLIINDSVEPYTFTDEQIEALLVDNDNSITSTCAALFTILATNVLTGGVKSYTIGNESYTMYDAHSAYMDLAEKYKNMSSIEAGSLFENFIDKDTDDEAEEQSSYKYLMGGSYSSE